jgi:acyl-CoA thioester hydrolase
VTGPERPAGDPALAGRDAGGAVPGRRDRATGPRKERREEVTRIRVRYPEVDRMNVAHHMHYLAWFEMGRTELMRSAGVPYAEVENGMGVSFPVIEAGARYRRPSRYDEVLEVRTGLGEATGPRVRFEYRIVRPADGELLAEGFSVHAALGPDGRARRVPAPLSAALARWRTRD